MARFCRYCGTELSDNAVFCKNCGSQVPKAEQQKIQPFGDDQGAAKPAPVFCRYCGGAVTNGAPFCKNCGASLKDGGAGQQDIRQQATVQNRPNPQNPNQYRAQMNNQPQVQRPQDYGQYNRNAGQQSNTLYSNGPRRRNPLKPLIAAVLVLALFVSFVYPGFVRTRLFGSGSDKETGGLILTPPEKDPDKRNTGNNSNGNLKIEYDLPTEEELEAEYAEIDAALENGTLFADDLSIESDPHPEYKWLYSSEDGWNVSDDSEKAPKQQPKILPKGTSKAFRMETPYGVTVSAEENELDKDRTFTLEPVSGEQIEQLEEVFVKDIEGPGMIMDAWELDAGLEDDEAFSGHFTLELDLDKMGVTKDEYPFLRFYRVDGSGIWYEYASQIEGNKAVINSNQNSFFISALVTGGVILAATAIIDGIYHYSGGAYLNPFTGTFPIYYKDTAVMTIMLDREQFKDILLLGNTTYYNDLKDQAKLDAIKETLKKHNLSDKNIKTSVDFSNYVVKLRNNPETEAESTKINSTFKSIYKKLLNDKVENDPDYVRVKANLKAYNDAVKAGETPPEIEQVEKVCEHAVRAWAWLTEVLKVKLPSWYKLRIELSGEERTSYGVTLSPYLGHPYIVIFMGMLGSGTSLTYDRLLCTLCHEMFHISQRKYAWDTMANYKFDEMSAQDVEGMACDYFKTKKIIVSNKDQILTNLTDAWYFALPLNDFSTTYPEGKISVSGSKKADASYPVAPFLTFLRSKYVKPEKTYSEIMNSYGETWKRGKVTYIMKTAFGLSDDEKDLTQAYRLFAKRNQTRFYLEALKPNINTVFSPIVELNGKKEINLWNKNYTIRVRRVQPKNLVKAGDEYALALKYHDNYAYVMPDFDIEPLNMRRDREYKIYSDGIFIEPRKASGKETVYLMEVDGGTGPVMGDKIWNSKSSVYTLYLMVKPEQPEVEKKGNVLELKFPDLGEEPEKEIIDSYVVTLRTGKTDVLQQQFTKKAIKDADGKPLTLDISKLKIKGNELTDEERKNLVVIIQECVENTYKSGKPCLGPESDPVPLENDIYGTWEFVSDIQEYSSPLLGGMVDLQNKTISRQNLGPDAPQEAKQQVKDFTDQYYQKQNEISNSVSKGKMIVRPTIELDVAEVSLKFPEAPEELYKGTYNRKTMQLTLERKNTLYSFTGADKEYNALQNDYHKKIESGTYDLKDFGLAPGMVLQIASEPDKKNPSKTIMTFTGDLDVNNQLVKLKSKLSGTKLSDEY
ncbi:zinc ribbon domain-containing protein [Oribacterium sp. NK2B42]|uniref:zinc ribbon domain-containing protein n=1 Tax=Oribacterium sp. NK2B42 TaxID=689781 RepID=UPI00049264A5|nr:zinc ribbon domain-containing protein [Oribacterium sp. NK2B42]